MRNRHDRGAISMSLLAPIVAALIGGAAAVTAAVQVVNLAPSAPTTPRTGVLTNGDPNSPELQYGNR
jgi:hypothetical protein